MAREGWRRAYAGKLRLRPGLQEAACMREACGTMRESVKQPGMVHGCPMHGCMFSENCERVL